MCVQQATEDVQQGLTQDDIDMYYEIWERYDWQTSRLLHAKVYPSDFKTGHAICSAGYHGEFTDA